MGRMSATVFAIFLQVGLGADDAQTGAPTGAVAEEKAALARIVFFVFYTLKLIVRTENLTVTRSFYRTVLELYHRYCKCWFLQ